MAFAGAPVEPVPGGLAKLQAAGEGFDLLPFAPRHIDAEARRRRLTLGCGQGADGAQCAGLLRQVWEGRWRRQLFGVVVLSLGLRQ